MRSAASSALIMSLLALTSGCASFGTNINGSFRCEAPDGICAPSTAIDDTALSEITRADAQELMTPTGPYKVDDGDGGRGRMANAEGVLAAQNQAYKLSVIFPGYTDVAGVTHQRRSVTTDVGLPGRTASSVELASRSRGRQEAKGLLSAAQSAPVLISESASQAAPPALAANAQDARPAPGTAVDRIKADVDAKLTTRARRQAASFPSPE
jgi:conjugal transfer pilus assembly protein TraV